jgi:hypothetical protein
MLGSKVLSPQYVIWLLPLVPLGAGGLAQLGVSAVFLAICWTTTQIFPFHYLEISAGAAPRPDNQQGRPDPIQDPAAIGPGESAGLDPCIREVTAGSSFSFRMARRRA